ncbi:hypothetical protein [uncultured Deinococcus sp.]|uniref:hypothetical protein n=1 Tax=uncultured Deinococcus sp. TaxID=158789 RepID=UPI0025F60F9A|nr:hypothetical protein [uncultured Deinococcus sp.]
MPHTDLARQGHEHANVRQIALLVAQLGRLRTAPHGAVPEREPAGPTPDGPPGGGAVSRPPGVPEE